MDHRARNCLASSAIESTICETDSSMNACAPRRTDALDHLESPESSTDVHPGVEYEPRTPKHRGFAALPRSRSLCLHTDVA